MQISSKNLTKISLCVALCCATAYVSFPLPFTPTVITLLTAALGLTAFILPPKETFIALIVYVLLGIIGMPVFVGGSPGLARLFGPTGGCIYAWIIIYPIISALKGKENSFKRYALLNIFLGMTVTYIGGIISMVMVMDITVWQTFPLFVFPCIPGDLLKSLLAAYLGVRINRALGA